MSDRRVRQRRLRAGATKGQRAGRPALLDAAADVHRLHVEGAVEFARILDLCQGMPCAQGRAMLFDAENGAWVLGSRLKALEEALPADRVCIYDAEGLRLSDPVDRSWMLQTIRAERSNFVVIDALRPLGRTPRRTAATAWRPSSSAPSSSPGTAAPPSC